MYLSQVQGLHFIWELRNADSWALPQAYCLLNQKLRGGAVRRRAAICILTDLQVILMPAQFYENHSHHEYTSEVTSLNGKRARETGTEMQFDKMRIMRNNRFPGKL